MFKILSYKENANQNYIKLDQSQVVSHQESKQQMPGRMWEKGTLIHCENIN
jgi:hypothetical protein